MMTALAGTILAQPVVNDGGILNAASYTSSRLPGGAIAQGSIFVVFGSKMGPAALAQAGFPLPSTLAGTSVKVTSGGQTLDCPLIYTVAGQLAAILPSATPVGNATLTVSFGGATSAARSFKVVASAFGTFAVNSAGSGPGVVQNYESASSVPVNSPLRSAKAGQTLILYGTGLGALPAGSADNAGAAAVAINQSQVEVYVGASKAAVSYAGRAPGFAGLDQINLIVPGNLSGCAVPVLIKTGTVISNATTIAISANGGVCSDPLGLSSAQLTTISNGGTIKIGSIALTRLSYEMNYSGLAASFSLDTGSADFQEFNAQTIGSSSSLNVGGTPSIGTCSVYAGTASSQFPVDPVQPRGLDAGTAISVNGPKGTKSLAKTPNVVGSYGATFATAISIKDLPPGIPGIGEAPYLDPGNYTFSNGAGGADVKGFNANYTLPQPLNWTNKSNINNVNRAAGQTVTWTGGDPAGFVMIYGYSASDLTEKAITGTFVCVEQTSKGSFTVPSAVLLYLPATPAGSSDTPPAMLGVGGISNPGSFTASGIDTGVIAATSIVGKTVTYQ